MHRTQIENEFENVSDKLTITTDDGSYSNKGFAIKPVAVRMVYQVAQSVTIPVLSMGGILLSQLQVWIQLME